MFYFDLIELMYFHSLFDVAGEVRVPSLQNGGPGWEGGGDRPPAHQPSHPPAPGDQGALPGPPGTQPPPPGPAEGAGGGGGQMNKKPTRRPGVKPPPDRAKRSIYLFSLKNPIRQLFIKVNSDNWEIQNGNLFLFLLDNRSKMVWSSYSFNYFGYLHITSRIHPFPQRRLQRHQWLPRGDRDHLHCRLHRRVLHEDHRSRIHRLPNCLFKKLLEHPWLHHRDDWVGVLCNNLVKTQLPLTLL